MNNVEMKIFSSIWTRLKRYQHIVGMLIGIICIYYVVKKLEGLDFDGISEEYYLPLLLGVVFFLFLGFLTGAAWWAILKHLGQDTSLSWAIYCFGYSQIGKYLPGNIFHLAGRQALSSANNIRQKVAASSQFLELIVLSICAASCSTLVLAELDSTVFAFASNIWFFWGVISIFAMFSILYRYYWLLASYFVYFVYFALSGSVFYLFVYAIHDVGEQEIELLIVVSAYALAWLAGTLTPGSPAGIGIREAVLLGVLSNDIAGSSIAMAAIFTRIANVVADVLLYLFSYFVLRPRLKYN